MPERELTWKGLVVTVWEDPGTRETPPERIVTKAEVDDAFEFLESFPDECRAALDKIAFETVGEHEDDFWLEAGEVDDDE